MWNWQLEYSGFDIYLSYLIHYGTVPFDGIKRQCDNAGSTGLALEKKKKPLTWVCKMIENYVPFQLFNCFCSLWETDAWKLIETLNFKRIVLILFFLIFIIKKNINVLLEKLRSLKFMLPHNDISGLKFMHQSFVATAPMGLGIAGT